MQFPFTRKLRPDEKVRLSIDFANDLAKVAGDTGATLGVTAKDALSADVTGAQVSSPLLVAGVGYATFTGGVSASYVLTYLLTTTLGFKYEHDITVECAATN